MAQRKSRGSKTTVRSRPTPTAQPVEQRSPNDQSLGGYDPEDYHAEEPVPVGNAPIHPSEHPTPGISAGVTAASGTIGNPGDVPNTGPPAGSPLAPMDRSRATMAAAGGDRHREDGQRMEGAMKHNAQMQDCIKNCQECHAVCMETVQHCLEMGGKHAQPDHIRLLLDCAQICQTSADFMLRGSPLHGRTCGLCAEICTQCADDCEKLAQGDSMMTKCAEICRRCAESCRQMANMPMAA